MSELTPYDRSTGEVLPRQGMPATADPPRARNLIFASAECAEVFGALCEFQGKCEPPRKTKTAKVKGTTRNGGSYDYSYNYAPLDEIHNVIREPMAGAGLAYRQFLVTMGEQWMMRTVVVHRSGEWLGCDYPIYAGQQQGAAQAFASGVTYARRYGLMLALGIVAEDDDDANVADGQPATINGQDRAAGRSGEAAAHGNGTAATRAPAGRPQAAPAPSDAVVEATKMWRGIAATIDVCDDAELLLRLEEWPEFADLDRVGAEASINEPAAHRESMDMLRARARKRREKLIGSLKPFEV